ncbi:hypothetical protein EU799_09705 [Corynebacterium silvaticum]|uniref:Uncharacterized protein n=1 Tax=Corynebacterium silvaticum TaxID=2320431 RepID=A0A7U5HLM6_9CORY|nr:hypothetical protein EU802_09295 [Corynebacterium silvaticum]TFA93452.1 hypothetical protein EU799_09705 [Corynebacterium silvaticum]TNX85210.1 hypothetical protein FIT55_04975 [Corynebacterium silvaticum]TRM14308.1 hypothetical protein ET810_011675 [Corynebacterium silvaticum]
MNRFLLGGRCKKAATVVVKNVQLDTLDGFLKKVLMAHKPTRHCEEEKRGGIGGKLVGMSFLRTLASMPLVKSQDKISSVLKNDILLLTSRQQVTTRENKSALEGCLANKRTFSCYIHRLVGCYFPVRAATC